jgi:hypothetical protein
MIRSCGRRGWRAVAAVIAAMTAARGAVAQSFELASPAGLVLHNVSAEAVTFAGRPAIRVTLSPETRKVYDRIRQAPPATPSATDRLETLALVPGVELGNGTIEIDLAGEPDPGAPAGARGFVGVAFRVQPEGRTYDAFYVRPTNGRAEDQERRNHTLQYVSEPDWPWYRLREETPGRYESYADVEPAKWIHLRIEIAGAKARLTVDGAEQPALIVNDLKSGADAVGAVALWIEGSTIAHFANLKITKQ